MQDEIRIRTVSADDAPELLSIYAPYVQETAITFEYEVPSEAEFRRRIQHTLERYPYLAAEQGGKLLGYAYAGTFIGRPAYDWSAETTIYLQWEQQGRGLGKRLYTALEAACNAQHIQNLYACIGCPEVEDEYLTWNSVQFHSHLGYAVAGKFHNCGYKFGRWYHIVWMEKNLGAHDAKPLPLIPFPALGKEILAGLNIQAI